MSFFTSLTGLNAATTQLSVTSNNIANAGTTGFKRSRSDFGDIYATSPLQKASTVVGQGTALKQVTQEFSQGNIELSGNSLDLAVTGEGFFPIDAGGNQKIYTRNGSFLLNERNEVVNSVGQNLLVAAVNSDGSPDIGTRGDPDYPRLQNLTIDSQTEGSAIGTSEIKLDLSLPTSARPLLTDSQPPTVVPFNLNSPNPTFAASSAVNIFDATGREVPLNVYYRRLQIANAETPLNKWETHIVVNGVEVKPELSQATNIGGLPIFVDKFGVEYEPDELPPGKVTDNTIFPKYIYDEIGAPEISKPARAIGSEITADDLKYKTGEDGVQFGATPATAIIDLPDFNSLSEMTLRTASGNELFLQPVAPARAQLSVQNFDALLPQDTIQLELTDEEGAKNTAQVTLGEEFSIESIASALKADLITQGQTNQAVTAITELVADAAVLPAGTVLEPADVITAISAELTDSSRLDDPDTINAIKSVIEDLGVAEDAEQGAIATSALGVLLAAEDAAITAAKSNGVPDGVAVILAKQLSAGQNVDALARTIVEQRQDFPQISVAATDMVATVSSGITDSDAKSAAEAAIEGLGLSNAAITTFVTGLQREGVRTASAELDLVGVRDRIDAFESKLNEGLQKLADLNDSDVIDAATLETFIDSDDDAGVDYNALITAESSGPADLAIASMTAVKSVIQATGFSTEKVDEIWDEVYGTDKSQSLPDYFAALEVELAEAAEAAFDEAIRDAALAVARESGLSDLEFDAAYSEIVSSGADLDAALLTTAITIERSQIPEVRQQAQAAERAFVANSATNYDVVAIDQVIDARGTRVPRLEIRNLSGTNFQLAQGSAHSVDSNDVRLFENISASGSVLSTTPSVLTANGYSLDDGYALEDLAVALNRASVNTEFNFSVIEEQLQVAHTTGESFVAQVNDFTANSVGGTTAPDLKNAFSLTIDSDPAFPNDTRSLSIDLSALTQTDFETLTGDQVASLMTREINRQFGDERYFDLTDASSRQFRIVWNDLPSDPDQARAYDIIIPYSTDEVSAPNLWRPEQLAQEIQSQLRELSGSRIDVQYDRSSHGFRFIPADSGTQLRIRNVPADASITGTSQPNTLFGLRNLGSDFLIDGRGAYEADVNPNGLEILPKSQGQQRYGLKVDFIPSAEEAKRGGFFAISSGTTGDQSSVKISNANEDAIRLFGFQESDQDNLTVEASTGSVAVRGLESTPARVVGKPVGFNPDDVFSVDTLTNSFTVTVNNVTESFTIPTKNDYDVNQLRTVLENRINAMADAQGNTVSGVSVVFDQTARVFRFETGNTGNNAFLQVRGPSYFGLSDLPSGIGTTETYKNPVIATSPGGSQIFVKLGADGLYEEFSADVENGFTPLPEGFSADSVPEFSPVFIGTGQLTFDTSGNLIFPSSPLTYKGVEISDGSSLDLTIDFGRSSQNSNEFSVNSQSQDGRPEGSLVALDIADDGSVTASYSNGEALTKGRIMLMRFPTPSGLRQLGDSTFLESNQSGEADPGTPGSPGFGTIRAGARERANVDLTSELVDLITAQRNFQANAKAIETSSTLTSTIINIRS